MKVESNLHIPSSSNNLTAYLANTVLSKDLQSLIIMSIFASCVFANQSRVPFKGLKLKLAVTVKKTKLK